MKIEERGLVRKILNEGKRAFAGFYKSHRKKLLGFVLKRVNNREDAEEIVQDTFLGFLDSLPVFGFRSSLKTYLYGIARHEIGDYFRRKYAKRVLKVVPIIGDVVDERLYSTGELSQVIDKVYKKMTKAQALVVRLKYEEGWSVKKIANKLKVGVKAAESRLYRARKVFEALYRLEMVGE